MISSLFSPVPTRNVRFWSFENDGGTESIWLSLPVKECVSQYSSNWFLSKNSSKPVNSLSRNKISNTGVAAIADGLTRNSVLTGNPV